MARAIITLVVMYAAGFAGGFVTKTFLAQPQTKDAFMTGCMQGAGIILSVVGLSTNDAGVAYIAKQCEKIGKAQQVWQ